MKAFVNVYASNSCVGNTKELMESIYKQQTGIRVDTSYIPESPAGLGKMKYNDFFETLNSVVSTVLDKSNLENFNDTLLIVGSSVGGMQESEQHYFKDKNYKNIDTSRHAISVLSDSLQKKFNFSDNRSISTACTSSANALLLAKRLINVGAYKNVLVVGADALCYTTVCGFYALGVLSSSVCTPFNENREGMNVAEAIGALLVQDEQTNDSVELIGVGASSDAYHMTNPDPEANGAISSMSNALKDAKLNINDIDYVNAHGTGTMANDTVEGLGVKKLFNDVYISSTKAITGHTLGAAGAIEAIISCEVIKQGIIPAQTNLTDAQNKNINIPNENIKKDIKYVISNSFAFGGNNTSIIFGGLN